MSSGTVELNNYLQRKGRLTALSWDESTSGLDHAPEWTCVCKIDGKDYGVGKGINKQDARKNAAREALGKLVEENP